MQWNCVMDTTLEQTRMYSTRSLMTWNQARDIIYAKSLRWQEILQKQIELYLDYIWQQHVWFPSRRFYTALFLEDSNVFSSHSTTCRFFVAVFGGLWLIKAFRGRRFDVWRWGLANNLRRLMRMRDTYHVPIHLNTRDSIGQSLRIPCPCKSKEEGRAG